MINISRLEIYQKVWFMESWPERIVCGFITGIERHLSNENHIIEIKGNPQWKDSFIGTTHRLPDDLFKTKEEVIAAVEEYNQKRVDNYKAEITDVASLVAFPITHPFANYEVIRAYKERAKELGFEIPN